MTRRPATFRFAPRASALACAAGLAVLAVTVATAVAPVPARAQEPSRSERLEERLREMRAQEERKAERKAYWQDLYRTALERERKAEARLDAAQATWSRGRGDDRLRGEPRAAALKELEDARKELEKARADVASIPERARQAGAPPGWLREVELDFPARPAAN